jgi:hypothetical protein
MRCIGQFEPALDSLRPLLESIDLPLNANQILLDPSHADLQLMEIVQYPAELGVEIVQTPVKSAKMFEN